MAYLSEKAAYLRGLCEGMNLEDNNPNKLLKAIIEALDDISFAVEELEEQQEEIIEELDEINEVMDEIADIIDEDDCCDSDCDCGCGDDVDFECPACGEIINVEEIEIENVENVICPKCGEKFELEVDCDCDCDCEKEKEEEEKEKENK